MRTSVVKALAFLLLVGVSQATPAYEYPYYVSTGTSKQYQNREDDGSYQFGYDEGHSSGGTFRKETGDAFGNKYGSYGLTDADGRYRVVNYIADSAGFRVDIKTNEPGTVPADPAYTTINKAAFVAAPAAFGVKTAPSGVKTSQSRVKTAPPPVKTSPSGGKTVQQVETAPSGVKTVQQEQTAPVFTEVKTAPVSSGFPAFPGFTNSLFYAPDVHYAATPEHPLLYRNHLATFGNYKGSPYTRRAFNSYKGSPYVGSPYVGSPYNTYKGSPYVGRSYPNYGYYVYP